MDEISNRMEYTTVIVVVVVVSGEWNMWVKEEVHSHHIAVVAFA